MFSLSLASECNSGFENYLLKPGMIKCIFYLCIFWLMITFLTCTSQQQPIMLPSPCGTEPTVKEQPRLKNSFINGPEESGETVTDFIFFQK